MLKTGRGTSRLNASAAHPSPTSISRLLDEPAGNASVLLRHHTLEAGNAVYFPGDRRHAFANGGRGGADPAVKAAVRAGAAWLMVGSWVFVPGSRAGRSTGS